MFNNVKSVCGTFNTLVCLSIEVLCLIDTNAQDDEDMPRQIRTLYVRSNISFFIFHYCYTDVKLELFKSYCTSLYCYLWTAYKN